MGWFGDFLGSYRVESSLRSGKVFAFRHRFSGRWQFGKSCASAYFPSGLPHGPVPNALVHWLTALFEPRMIVDARWICRLARNTL
jgi:hypothetical protein